jgi:hypothetical protein
MPRAQLADIDKITDRVDFDLRQSEVPACRATPFDSERDRGVELSQRISSMRWLLFSARSMKT